MRLRIRFVLPIILALALALGVVAYKRRPEPKPVLPVTQNRSNFPPPPPSATPSTQSPLPAEVNLAVPFTSQAPHKNWAEPYQNFCEEASLLMAASYILNQPIGSIDDADAKLLEIMNFEIERFGHHKDTTIAEVSIVLREKFKINDLKTIDNPTVDDIKRAVADGKAVIVPAAGQDLPNPNFRPPGPVYHMLVVKGYTKDGKFITNDPGTRLGADFLYNYNDLMDTIHDWNEQNIYDGKRVVLVVG